MHGFQTTFSAKRNSKTLEIPRWYSNYMKMKTPSKAYLQGPRGGTWAVELVRKHGRLYFEQGWNEFHTCHFLRDKDLLVFRYDDKPSFKVKMYQEKLVQYINQESLQVNVPNSEDTQPQCAVKHEIKEVRATDSLDQDRLSFVKTMKHYNISRSLVLALPGWFISEHFSGYGNKFEVVLENTRRQQWTVTLVSRSKTMSGGWSQFVRDNEIKEGDTCKFVLVRRLTMLVHISPKKASSQKELKRQDSPEETRLRFATRGVLKHADDNEVPEHRLPQNVAIDFPSFTIHMKLYNVRSCLININAKFVSSHCCNYGKVETITLQNEQGKQWSATMYRQRRGASLSRGWPLFVQDNQIKEKDTCTFKLVDERKFLVHISRHCETSQVVPELKRQANPGKIQLRSATRQVLEYADDNEAREHKPYENIVTSDFPSFTIPMKHYNVRRPGILNISAEFVSTHWNYGQMATITLENEQGKQWPANMYPHHRNGGRLSGGWPLFVRDNQIKENDTCTFTLVDARKMLVQISRYCGTSQAVPEEDPRVKLEHPTCNTDRKRRSDGVNKRKRGSEKADIAMQVAAAARDDIAVLREENRKILQLLQEMNNSGAK